MKSFTTYMFSLPSKKLCIVPMLSVQPHLRGKRSVEYVLKDYQHECSYAHYECHSPRGKAINKASEGKLEVNFIPSCPGLVDILTLSSHALFTPHHAFFLQNIRQTMLLYEQKGRSMALRSYLSFEASTTFGCPTSGWSLCCSLPSSFTPLSEGSDW